MSNPTRKSEVSRGPRPTGARRAAFTLVELLVVMGVILVLVVTTLPAFRAIQASGRVSGATNAVTSMLNGARAQAVREGRDVAVMFRFDTTRQICSMEVLVADATVYSAGNGMTAATVFVPVKGQAPMDLPKGAAVFGYGYGASRGSAGNAQNWYPDLGNLFLYSQNTDDPWLLPRTDPRVFAVDAAPTTAGVRLLDTFIVRFSPEGTVVSNAEELGSLAAGGNAFLDLDEPEDQNYRIWNPEVTTNNNNLREKVVHAEYQLRSVPMIAIADILELGSQLGLREPWMVVGDSMPTSAQYQDANENGQPDQIEINEWIEANAPPISFNRFTGELMRDIKR